MSEPPRGPRAPEPAHVAARPAVARPAASRRVLAWLNHRTGYGALVKLVTDEPIPGGARWWYTSGALLTFLLLVEGVTGVLLAAHFAPTTAGAWASTAFIQDTLTMGWFIRGLHSLGSSALLVVCALHAAQVLLFGAYRAPREMTWIAGLGLGGLVLAFALSGTGLPWDESGFWEKRIESNIVGGLPLIGRGLQRLLQGGADFGNYTLTHLYTVHVLVLPGVMALLFVAHLALVRRHGITPRWSSDETELARRTQTYWPHQAARDALACTAVFVILTLLAVRTHGAWLDGPADPAAVFAARPRWYALPLFEVRHALGPSLELLATVAAPALLALALLAMPWLDRGRTRAPGHRVPVLLGALIGALGLVVLGVVPVRRDARDNTYQRETAERIHRAQRARELARAGVPPEGGLAVYRNDPAFRARELWDQHCARCHSFTGAGGREGPDFQDYNSRAWLREFLRDPEGDRFMGPAHITKPMEPVQGTDEELDALAEMVYAQTGAPDTRPDLLRAAQPLFATKDCNSCHERDGTTEGNGPNLLGRGTMAWLVDVIADPGQGRLYGKKNKMPAFGAKLTPEEIAELARFLLTEARR